MSAHPRISVVIPVYNEELNLPALFARLYPVLDALGRPYEVIFTNDGSRDRSFELLKAQHAARPGVTRVIDFNANYGQHMAIMAAFERVRGEVIVTLDADLQNPPEEIPKLLALIDAGHDYVGGFRINRRDSAFRTLASKAINAVRRRTTSIEMTDQGCMLRAYSRPIVDAIVRSGAINTFIPGPGLQLRRQPGRGRRQARGAPCRRLELFVLQADPAQFRPHHRLLARAAAAVHDVRARPARLAASSSSWSWPTAAWSWAPRRRASSPCSASCSSS